MKGKYFCLILGVLFLGFLWGCGSDGGNSNNLTTGEILDDNSNSPGGNSGSSLGGNQGNSSSGGSLFIREFSIPADENGNLTAPYGLAKDERRRLIWFSAEVTSNENSPDMIGVFDTVNELFPICQSGDDSCRIVLNSAPNQPSQQQPPNVPKVNIYLNDSEPVYLGLPTKNLGPFNASTGDFVKLRDYSTDDY